jgi:hypothetical protein
LIKCVKQILGFAINKCFECSVFSTALA